MKHLAALCLLVTACAHRSTLAPPPSAGAMSKYVYKTAAQGPLEMTLHFPAGWRARDRRPAIVFFFGGGWQNGDIKQFATQAAYLAGRGMVAARADYRVKARQNTTPIEAVEDAKSAIRWLRAHAADLGIDAHRIVGAGGSAGGHLAACAALCDGFEAPGEDKAISSRPDLLVLFNPVLDLPRQPELARVISPLASLRAGTPATVMFYGTADPYFEPVPAYRKKARDLGVTVELYTAADQPHSFFNRAPWQLATLLQADHFLVSQGYLQGPPTLGPQEPLAREP